MQQRFQNISFKGGRRNLPRRNNIQGAFPMHRGVAFMVSVFIFLPLATFAQENRSEISLQGTALFTRSTSGNGLSYSATESGGLLSTYRYHINRWISAEGAYGYSLNTQKYSLLSDAFRVQSRIHQFTGSLVVNLPSSAHSRFNPYILAGGGGLLFSPTNNSLFGAQAQTKGAFVYGAGANFAVYKGLSLRAEYRGLVYSSPNFGLGGLTTNAVIHTAMPSIGLTLRF